MVSRVWAMVPPVCRKRRCRVSGVALVAGAEPAAQGCADGAGEHGQDDVEVDVERDGTGQGVEVEGADGLGEALFDGHPAGEPSTSWRVVLVLVGDDHGGGVATQAADQELPDGAGVAGDGGLLVDDLGRRYPSRSRVMVVQEPLPGLLRGRRL
jgi:hypothetical protein